MTLPSGVSAGDDLMLCRNCAGQSCLVAAIGSVKLHSCFAVVSAQRWPFADQ